MVYVQLFSSYTSSFFRLLAVVSLALIRPLVRPPTAYQGLAPNTKL